MSHKLIAAALSADLVQSGTVAFSYPTGTNKGDFTTYDASLVTSANDIFSTENGKITVSLGDTAATITMQAATTILSGTAVQLELNQIGTENPTDQLEYKTKLKDAVVKQIIRCNLGNPLAIDDNGIADDLAAVATAAEFVLTDFVTAFQNLGGVLDVPRNVILTGTTGSNHVVTIVGEDLYGDVMHENITLSGTGVIAGAKAFSKITGINVAAGASGDTFDAGWGDVLGLPVFTKRWHDMQAQYVDDELVATNEKVSLDFVIDSVELLAGTSVYIVSPVYGFVSKMTTVLTTAINTTGGSLTVELATTAVTGLTVVIGNDAVGTIDTDTPTAEFGLTGQIAKDDDIEIVGDAAIDSTGAVNGTLQITPGGSFVAADETTPTATTGDVRGTWVPPLALLSDGTRIYTIDIATADSGYLGVDNFDG